MRATPAQDTFNNALFHISRNINNIASQFGPLDYPNEWKTFRNYLFGFARSFFQAMDFHLREKPQDLWTRLNAGVIAQVSSEQLITLTSQCHYLVYSMYPYNFDSCPHDAKQMIIALNWLTNIYGNDHGQTERWFELCCQRIEYPRRYEILRNAAYQEIASVTSSDPHDEQRSGAWGGLAMMASLVQSQYEEKHCEEWTKECEGIFD